MVFAKKIAALSWKATLKKDSASMWVSSQSASTPQLNDVGHEAKCASQEFLAFNKNSTVWSDKSDQIRVASNSKREWELCNILKCRLYIDLNVTR